MVASRKKNPIRARVTSFFKRFRQQASGSTAHLREQADQDTQSHSTPRVRDVSAQPQDGQQYLDHSQTSKEPLTTADQRPSSESQQRTQTCLRVSIITDPNPIHPTSFVYTVQHTDLASPITTHQPPPIFSTRTNALTHARQLWLERRYNLLRGTAHQITHSDNDNGGEGLIFEITDTADVRGADARVWVRRCAVRDAGAVGWRAEGNVVGDERVVEMARGRARSL